MHIGIVAYDFPPLNSGGSQRPYYLARYLKAQNIKITVFAPNLEHYPSEDLNYEVDLNFFNETRIIRTNIKKNRFWDTVSKSYYFNIIDNLGPMWRAELMGAVTAEHSVYPFDYLLFTCPPFSLADLGVVVSNKVGVPLILDMRDAWSLWVTAPFASYFHYQALRKLENKVLKKAKWVMHTSSQHKRDWLRVHPGLDTEKFIFVPNGFLEFNRSTLTDSSRIRIFYSGGFYYNPESGNQLRKPWYKRKPYRYFQYVLRVEDWKYRSPFFFFSIVQQLLKGHPYLRDSLEIRFAGKKPDWFDDMVKGFELRSIVVHLGFINKDQVNKEMAEADYFLLTSAKVNSGRDYSIAGKTFEYFSYKKPIIGVVCDGEQKDVLERSGMALILDPDQVEAGSEQLRKFLLNNKLSPNYEFINQFKVPNNYSELMERINL